MGGGCHGGSEPRLRLRPAPARRHTRGRLQHQDGLRTAFAEQLWKGTRTNMSEVRRWGYAAMYPGPCRACSRLPGYARQGRVLVVVGVPPAGCHRHFELTHLHTWNWELQRRRARSVCYIVVGRRQGFESEPSALPSEACSSVGQSLSVPSTSVDDSRFPNPESSAVTAFLHSRNDSVISNRSRSPADQPSEEFALRRRRVCVIAGLRVSGMPASTGHREQSVCFFAGGRAGVPHQNAG